MVEVADCKMREVVGVRMKTEVEAASKMRVENKKTVAVIHRMMGEVEETIGRMMAVYNLKEEYKYLKEVVAYPYSSKEGCRLEVENKKTAECNLILRRSCHSNSNQNHIVRHLV